MTTPLLRLTTSKIRRMSKRRQKIAALRRMTAYVRCSIADMVGKPLNVDEVKRRTEAALSDLISPPMVITSSRLDGDVLHVDIKCSRPIGFVQINSTIK